MDELKVYWDFYGRFTGDEARETRQDYEELAKKGASHKSIYKKGLEKLKKGL